MNALLNTLEYFLKLAGVLLILLFIAWALVTLGLLADSTYLLHMEKSSTRAKKRPATLQMVAKTDTQDQSKKAA